MLQIFRRFFFLTFSDSVLPDVIMIACGATLNRQTYVVTHGDDKYNENESNGELAVAHQVLVEQALVYYDFKG